MDFAELGKKIYDMSNPREYRRYLVFRVRCLLNRGRMNKLWDYFHSMPTLEKIAEVFPFVFEQPQRAFLLSINIRGATRVDRGALFFFDQETS